MTIRLLRNERIAVDGVQVRWYRVGDIINVPDSLAAALIRDKIATSDLQAKPEPKEENLPLAHTPKQEMAAPIKKREYRK